jgi:hypothetical protein
VHHEESKMTMMAMKIVQDNHLYHFVITDMSPVGKEGETLILSHMDANVARTVR